MARILIYAPAATAAGGVRYLANLLPRLATARPQDEFVVLTSPQFVFDRELIVPNVRLLPKQIQGAFQHLWWDTIWLGRFVRREGVDLIVATGGFAMPHPPRPQILMNYNALYFSPIHSAALRRRGLWWARVEMNLRRAWAYRSMYGSMINIVPTNACGDLMAAQSQRPIPGLRTIHHGFDADAFVRDARPLDRVQLARLESRPRGWRLLLASHYNYFRNFETVLRALAMARERCRRNLQLVLTTTLAPGLSDRGYDTSRAARLLDDLGLDDSVIMLGEVAQTEIATLHGLCDAAISPGYVESFGFPMVEAMGCGRAVLAADSPVHREVCQDAASFFPVFDADALAERMIRLAEDSDLAGQLAACGRRRARQFSWSDHVEQLGGCLDECLGQSKCEARAA